MGIEPTYLAWKASVLPLNYTRTPEPVRTSSLYQLASAVVNVRIVTIPIDSRNIAHFSAVNKFLIPTPE